eukprot:scaffold2236_cov385-Prasinococcus_capsulatus_cf.AAC.14
MPAMGPADEPCGSSLSRYRCSGPLKLNRRAASKFNEKAAEALRKKHGADYASAVDEIVTSIHAQFETDPRRMKAQADATARLIPGKAGAAVHPKYHVKACDQNFASAAEDSEQNTK